MHRVEERDFDEIHSEVTDVRNRLAVSLESLRVPVCKYDYKNLSSTLANLRAEKEALKRQIPALENSLHLQEREIERLEEEKGKFEDFRKTKSKQHPLTLSAKETELHLHFDQVQTSRK